MQPYSDLVLTFLFRAHYCYLLSEILPQGGILTISVVISSLAYHWVSIYDHTAVSHVIFTKQISYNIDIKQDSGEGKPEHKA